MDVSTPFACVRITHLLLFARRIQMDQVTVMMDHFQESIYDLLEDCTESNAPLFASATDALYRVYTNGSMEMVVDWPDGRR